MAAPAKTDIAACERLITEQLKKAPKDGIPNDQLMASLAAFSKQDSLKALNNLLKQAALQILKTRSGSLVYKLKDANPATRDLGTSEKLVLQLITQAGNKGIWTRDIRVRTGLQQAVMSKILKTMESQKMIKSVKAVTASTKKLYMLYALEPDRSLTGGAWYNEAEFEEEFVSMLRTVCLRFIHSKHAAAQQLPLVARVQRSYVSAREVQAYVRKTNISNVALSEEDIESILDTLVYDEKITEARSGSGMTPSQCGDGEDLVAGTRMFRALGLAPAPVGLTTAPCGLCPVFDKCANEGLITPHTCVYMKEWLSF